MIKLFKDYKEKKAFKEFITDKVDRVADSYKVRVLTSEKRLSIVNNKFFDNVPYKVDVTTIDNHLANNKVYTFRSNTPYSNENDLQQIEDTINDLWDKRAEEKQAKVENKIKENAKYYQQDILEREVVKMGMDKHLVDITFSETKVSKDWNTNNGTGYFSYHYVAEFTVNVANLKYLSKDNDLIIKHYNLMISLSKDGDSYYSVNLGRVVNSIASYIDGLDKYVMEQERLKKLMN